MAVEAGRRAVRKFEARASDTHRELSAFMPLDGLKHLLCCIGQVVVISQPAVVDAVEAIASLNFPIASGFPHLGGKQYVQLTICWNPQGTIFCPIRNSFLRRMSLAAIAPFLAAV
jgi:hypothetical protein